MPAFIPAFSVSGVISAGTMRLRRRAGHRQRPHLAGGLVEHGHEAVAADAVHLRLAEPGHRADRRRGVEGVAALDQDLQPGRRRDGMSGRHQPVPSGHGGPGHARGRLEAGASAACCCPTSSAPPARRTMDDDHKALRMSIGRSFGNAV